MLKETHKSELETCGQCGREISVKLDFFQCSWIFDGDQVNIMKAWKSNSALSVTSRPPRLALYEPLQQKELLRH